jgi:hypothetical protein
MSSEFRELIRKRKAMENDRLSDRLDRLSEQYFGLLLDGRDSAAQRTFLETVVSDAKEGGPLRLALLNRRMTGDLPSRARRFRHGLRGLPSLARRRRFIAALKEHCHSEHKANICSLLQRPKKRQLQPRPQTVRVATLRDQLDSKLIE